MTNDDNFELVLRQLCSITKLDADMCLADSKLLFANVIYKSIGLKSSFQSFTATTVELQHNKLYKHYYTLVVFLLTRHKTSASREHARSKIYIVKSAVHMTSERLEDFILVYSDKTIFDNSNIHLIIDKFVTVSPTAFVS
jgi:hypothetical protein